MRLRRLRQELGGMGVVSGMGIFLVFVDLFVIAAVVAAIVVVGHQKS